MTNFGRIISDCLFSLALSVLAVFGKQALSVHAVFGKQALSVHAVFGKQALSVLAVFGKQALSVHAVFGKQALSVHAVFGKQALSVHAVFGKQALSVHAVFGKQALSIHAVFGKQALSVHAVFGIYYFVCLIVQISGHRFSNSEEEIILLNGRVKSMGDLLDSRSLSDHGDFLMDDVPGRTSRPKSMYEGSNLRLVNATTQNGAAYSNRQQMSQPPPAPPPPPPGPGPKMAPTSTPVADYNTEEDSAKYKKNPKFAGIQLRKTETKDRSAPKI
ncbi:unnamed protein product [Mytilus coruscus]|uniref:Uncharacterized protein n=1 Tax=Mytilus coruscus TaxID=42192 RepID=A0A6J8B7K1_MYTCO|nr:unnamed protein product [Mytilus coruscus]